MWTYSSLVAAMAADTLGGNDPTFGSVVEAIVDHHKDFGQHVESVLPNFRDIRMVGSACSLIAESMEVRCVVPRGCRVVLGALNAFGLCRNRANVGFWKRTVES